jgi:hypothetical protein
MSSAARAPIWVDFKLDSNVTPASRDAVFVVEPTRIESKKISAGRGVVVELRKRNFAETAAHFLRIATPVNIPSGEPDID